MSNSEFRTTDGPVRFICAECGSDDVYGSASVVWDDEIQMWGVEGHIDTMHCRTCDRENIEVHQVQLKRPVNGDLPVFMRAKRNEEGV
jgi:hypothetical protein